MEKCRVCGDKYDLKEIVRQHGKDSQVYLHGCCSAQCYTKWRMEKMEELISCEACGKKIKIKESFMNLCGECEKEGFWVDPAGGLHSPNEDDPAAMYE